MASTAAAAGLPVVVVGAGLAGSMMALMVARQGFRVELYEKRSDSRVEERQDALARHLGQSTDPTKRSINLALSERGRAALAAVGLEAAVVSECVVMPGRAIHGLAGGITFQPYGTSQQAILSASRALLNRVLLEACERESGIKVFFEHALQSVDADGTAVFEDAATRAVKRVRAALVVGADGAYSAVRGSMLRLSRMNFSREYIRHGYKELTIPPLADGAWALATPNALHVWPRHDFMLIALPNPDRTFTCTLFLPWGMLDALDADPASVRPFFERHFADALPLLPQLETQFATSPSSALVMIKCDPWHVRDRLLLVGDAAHGIVPFYGQGAMAAFEDCLCFTEQLAAAGGDLSRAVPAFAAARRPAGDAIAQLSLENYIEMRHRTASTAFLLRLRLEAALHWLLPRWWVPRYTMVSFTRIPYDQVLVRAERQDAILSAALAAATVAAVAGAAFLVVRSGAARALGTAACRLARRLRLF